MTKPDTQKLRPMVGILTAAAIFVAAVCLMAGCLELYRADSFTPEAVAATFAGVRIPVYLCLALVVAGLVLDLFLPCSAARRQPNFLMQLTAQRSRSDIAGCDEATGAALAALHARRTRRHLACALVYVTAAVLFLLYALDGSHFHTSQINQSMVAAMPLFTACLAVSFAAAVYSGYRDIADARQELALLKQAPKATASPSPAQSTARRPVAALVIAAIALAALLFGLFTGGTADVLTKAVNICTECVGLG